jgi:hypothetical protein
MIEKKENKRFLWKGAERVKKAEGRGEGMANCADLSNF